MFALLLSALSLIVPSILTTPSPRWDYSSYTGPSNAVCTRKTYTINLPPYPVIPMSPAIVANPNQTLFTAYIQRFVSNPVNFTEEYFTDGTTMMPASHHDLSGVLCVPKAGDKHKGTVQLLQHGLAFDSGYWDIPYHPEIYSYVQAAAAAGYTTFRNDRLGTGQSEHPGDAFRTVQAPTDVAILAQFVGMLRAGAIGSTKFTKVVGIGHSYGSVQMAALSAIAPTLVDGIIIQGFSGYTPFLFQFLTSSAFSIAANVFPSRFGDLPSGYVVAGLQQTAQINFFYWPEYDPVLADVTRELEQPVSGGVLLTTTSLAGSSNYTGPVYSVTGDRDWIFCGDQCNTAPGPSNLTILQLIGTEIFPMSKDFSIYSPPETGHGVNQHYSAPTTYAKMIGWIEGHGF